MASGQVVILGRNRDMAHRIVDCAPAGSVMEVSAPKRTLDQNAKLWALLSDISRAKPQGRVMTTEQWKCVFIDALGIKARWVPSLDGESVVNTGYRSSRLTKAQMSDLIEMMTAYAAEHGIELGERAA